MNAEYNSFDNRTRNSKRSRIKGKIPSIKPLRGRERIDYRNRVLIARYYYWTEIRRLRFDDVINILSTREFFVGDRTITNALLDLSVYLDELYQKTNISKYLKQEYPGWDWEGK